MVINLCIITTTDLAFPTKGNTLHILCKAI